MEDYLPNKQTVGESPKEQSVEEPQPEQSVSDLQSVGDASQNEKRRQLLMATNKYDDSKKAATERKRKSRTEKNARLQQNKNVRVSQKKNACC